MSGLFRMLNRILLWFNILRRVRGVGLKMQLGLLFSSLVDSLMIFVEPALARLPMIYVQGIVYSPKYKAYFHVRRFSDDLYSVMPDREGDVNEKILQCLSRGSLFVDVGANVGYYSVLAAKKLVGNEGLVIAVEPNPETARILISNIVLNGLSNVRVLQVAAWDKKETIKLHVPRHFFGLSSVRKANESTEVSVHAIPLDMIFTGLRRQIDLIKIDAEGAEIHVLKGLEKTLNNLINNIILEASDNMQEIASLLKAKGFKIRKLKFTNYIHAYREDLITS